MLLNKLHYLIKEYIPSNRDKIFRLSINELQQEQQKFPAEGGKFLSDKDISDLQDKTLHPFDASGHNEIGYHITPKGKFFVKTIKTDEPELLAAREKVIHNLGAQTSVAGLGGLRTLRTEKGHSHTVIMPWLEGHNVYDETLMGDPQSDEEIDNGIRRIFKRSDKNSALKNYFLNIRANVGDRNLGNIKFSKTIPHIVYPLDFEYSIFRHPSDSVMWNRMDPVFHYYIKHHPEERFDPGIIKPFLTATPNFNLDVQQQILPFYSSHLRLPIMQELHRRAKLLRNLAQMQRPTFQDIINMHKQVINHPNYRKHN